MGIADDTPGPGRFQGVALDPVTIREGRQGDGHHGSEARRAAR